MSAFVFSKDGKLLMGKKDPSKGGVYPNVWHIPGGGVDEGEDLLEAIIREVQEEVGIDITSHAPALLHQKGSGVSEKLLKDTGEKVLCYMEFNRFEVHINDKMADEIEVRLGDDLVSVQWFDREELQHVEQIPGGREST